MNSVAFRAVVFALRHVINCGIYALSDIYVLACELAVNSAALRAVLACVNMTFLTLYNAYLPDCELQRRLCYATLCACSRSVMRCYQLGLCNTNLL